MKRFFIAFLALLCIQAIGLNLSNQIQLVDLSKVQIKAVDYECSHYQGNKQRDLCLEIERHINR